LRTAAVSVSGSLLAGRAVGRTAAETSGSTVSAQETAPQLQWQATYRGDEDDHSFVDCRATDDGGVVLAGLTDQSSRSGVPWAVKLNAEGTEVWNRTYDTDSAAAEYLLGALPAHDGGTVLVGGRMQDFGSQDTDARGDSDVVVRKIDDGGAQQWEETHGGTDRDWAYGSATLQDSGYLFCGYTYSYTDAPKHDLWARKVDDDGTTAWEQTVGTDPAFYANAAAATGDGGAVLAGGRWYDTESERNQLVVKLDRGGAVEWRRTYGSSGLDSSAFAVVETDDGYAFAGRDGDRGFLYELDDEGRELSRTALGSGVSPGTLLPVDGGRFLVGGQRTVDDSDRRWLAMVGARKSFAWQQTYEVGNISTLAAADDTTFVAGRTDTDGWAGALPRSEASTNTDTESGDSAETDAGEDDPSSDDGNTNAFGPGFGPLAALSGIGIGAYRLYEGSNDE